MEDGVIEDPARPKEASFLGKAGWLKKATGRFLISYKDRYIQVEKTEIIVYENENLQTCLERVDLENYDKCHEMRSAFKKNRLVLIRVPKPGNKVHNVKLQAQSPEDREAWIKAFTDGINRAKNKIFDEVKVGEDSNLEHVTRSRPKGNRNRRPPTRIHMKEVAILSSDGILRLDLDVVDSSTPNGTYYMNVDIAATPEEAPMPPSKPSGAPEDDRPEEGPQTGVFKPPMPPPKEAKPSAAEWEEPPKKKILMPPKPPSKEATPAAPAVPEASKEDSLDDAPEKSPETGIETGQPPVPPNKPSNGSTDLLAEAPQSSQAPTPSPPPCKDKKPALPTTTSEITPSESDGVKDEDGEEGEEEEESSEVTLSDVKPNSVPESVTEVGSSPSPPEEVLTNPATELPELTTTEEETPELSEPSPKEKDSAPSGEVDTAPKEELQVSQLKAETPSMPTSEPIPKKKGPPTLFKKKPIKTPCPKAVAPLPATEESQSIVSPPEEKPPPTTTSPRAAPDGQAALGEEPSLPAEPETVEAVLSLADPVADSPSPESCRRSLEKSEREEEKSVDSGQHSDEGEGSESEDILAVSSSSDAPGSGSRAGLDVSEDDAETPDSLGQSADEDPHSASTTTPTQTAPLVSSPKVHSTFKQVQLNQAFRPAVPLKPSAKARSASLGDLLSESSACVQKSEQVSDADAGGPSAPRPPGRDLESIVALELEKPGELPDTVAPEESPENGQSSAQLGGSPEERPAKPTEQLETAAQLLREAASTESKLSESDSKRNSW